MEKGLELTGFDTAHLPRPHVNAFVRLHHPFYPHQRLEAAVKAGWNVFKFPSEMLMGGDLLSDSGTTTLTLEQLSALLLGDEAYGSNWGYFQLIEQMDTTFGLKKERCEYYLFHQGRAAEHALFSHLKGEGLVIPSNSFFDTTRANAEANGITALDLPDTSDPRFAGNIDLGKLERVLKKHRGKVPFVLMTLTNNTGGGQPVSMENLYEAHKLASDRYDVQLFFDMCRFAENAWFIKQREEGFASKDIPRIVHQMFSCCEGFTISFKKDGMANMGGALVIRRGAQFLGKQPHLLETLRDHQILTEGHPTYGGMSGRDIMTIVEGLRTVVKEEYLEGRIRLVNEFGSYLASLGVPVVQPFGGHAVYIDVDEFFADTKMRREDFGGISLTALLLLKGVRLCELGAFAFGKFDQKTGKEKLPARNYVRAAVPRNKYEIADLRYVADCIGGLYERRHELPRAIPESGREKTLRHMKARFQLEYR